MSSRVVDNLAGDGEERELGFEAEFIKEVPYALKPGVRFLHQAKFHPLKYLGPLLESIQFQRQYSGAQVPEGAKSVSFRVTVGAPDRTLSSDEIAAIRTNIIERMRELDFELRV